MTSKEMEIQNKLAILDTLIRGGASVQDPEKLARGVNKAYNVLFKGETDGPAQGATT